MKIECTKEELRIRHKGLCTCDGTCIVICLAAMTSIISYMTTPSLVEPQSVTPLLAPAERQTLLDIAVHSSSVLSKHNITHWLDFGSLLGAIRDGRIIDWDDDVDFSLHVSDRDKVLALRGEFEAKGFQLWLEPFHDIIRVGTRYQKRVNHIDLFFYEEVEKDVLRYEYLDVFCFHARHVIEPLSWVTMDGHVFPAPHDPAHLLRSYYGNDCLTTAEKYLSGQEPPATAERLQAYRTVICPPALRAFVRHPAHCQARPDSYSCPPHLRQNTSESHCSDPQ